MLEGYDYSKEVQLEFWSELSEVGNSVLSSISTQMKSVANEKSFEKEKSYSQEKTQSKDEAVKSLDNTALIAEIRQAAKNEQDLTLQVIELIAEINRRKIFLKLGFSSLFDFVTKDLGYEPSSAMRRIQAARAISEIPELKEKIADKSLSLSVVSQGQNFLNKKASDSGKKISIAEKTELFKKLENKSTREAEKELFKLAPELCLKSKEQEKVLSENLIELRFVIDKETKEKMDELKLWMSHQNPDMTQAQFFKVIVGKLHGQLAKKKSVQDKSDQDSSVQGKSSQDRSAQVKSNKDKSPQEKSSQNKSTDAPQVEQDASITGAEPPAEISKEKLNPIASQSQALNKPSQKRSRYISASVKKLVWQRDQGCCQFVDSGTQKKCQSRYQIQLDHIVPFRHLGDNSTANLRLLCGKHNRARD